MLEIINMLFTCNVLIGMTFLILFFYSKSIDKDKKDIFEIIDEINQILEKLNNEKLTNFFTNFINNSLSNKYYVYMFLLMLAITPIINLLMLITVILTIIKVKSENNEH